MTTYALTFEYWDARKAAWLPFSGHIIRGSNKPIPINPGDDIRLTTVQLPDGSTERGVIRVTYPEGRFE